MAEDYHDALKREFDKVDWSNQDSMDDFDAAARSISSQAEWDYGWGK